MSIRGGKRPGAGRKPSTGVADGPSISFRLSSQEADHLDQVLFPGETRSSLAQRLLREEVARRCQGQ